MTRYLDHRGSWVRQRTFELQQSGLSWVAAHEQAESEAADKFGTGENGPGRDPSWIRQRTYELQTSGLRYVDARAQAEAEADEKFDEESGRDDD